jgi:beta-lactamase class C
MQTKQWSIVIIFLVAVLIMTSLMASSEEADTVNLDDIINNIPTPVERLVREYSTFLQQQIDSTNTVGAAVAIISHDSLVFLNTYGVKKVGTNDSVDLNTIFRLASVSKGFAGVLSAKLDEDGIIDLDDRIIKFLPEFKLKDSANTCDLTIRHTLNHTSGLVPHAFDNLVEAGIPMSEIIGRLKNVDIAALPGKVYGYQNAMFSLIDTILKVKTNKSYDRLLKEQLFVPLGMNNASTLRISEYDSLNVAQPHVIGSGKYVPVRLKSNYYSASHAAGVNASISDMSKWLKALLGNNPEVMDSVVLNKITTPTIYTPLKRRYTWRWGKVDDRHYSLGWRIYNYYNRDIIYHGGYLRGYRAEIAFCPEEKTGIVFLQNSPNKLASMSVPEFWKKYFEIRDLDSDKVKAN